MTLRNSSTTLIRPFLVASLAAACLAATPDRFTKIPVEDPASVKHLRDSIAELTKRLEKTPNDIPARIELAVAYAQLAEFDSAERELTSATTTAPDNAKAWAAYGDLKCARQQWQDAFEPLTKAISLGNAEGTTFLNLAIAYQRTEDRTRALEYYTRALEHNCDIALLYRGRLHGLMGKVNLAFADFDNAIEHNVDTAQAYLQRGYARHWQHDTNGALDDYSQAISLDPQLATAYHARARLRSDAIGDYRGAIDDLTRAIEINPKSAAAYGVRGTFYLEHREYDKGIADINEAIRLNESDLGQTYEPATDKVLDPAALEHGEEQLRKILDARPRMAEHIEKGDKLWNWAVRKLAGEDLGSPISWDPTSPDPFASRSVEPTSGQPAMIELNLLQPVDHSQQVEQNRSQQTFEQLWGCTVYELYNVTSSAEWERLTSEADSGKLNKEQFIQAMMRSESNAAQRTRAFFIKFYLPWLRSKDLNATVPRHWFCDDFADLDNLRSDYAYDGNNVYLSFYENSYDLRAAYLEGTRGNLNGAIEILTRVLTHPDGLAESQRSYARDLLAWAMQSSGDKEGALEHFAKAVDEITKQLRDEPKNTEALYSRAMALNGLGRNDEALADVNAALAAVPKSADLLVARANLLGRAGKYDDANRDLEAALAIDPGSQKALNLRGYIDYYRHDYAQAVEDFTKAFEPNDSQTLRMRGYSLLMLKEYEKALPDFNELIRLEPKEAYAYAWRGGAHHFLKQFKNALADYDRAIELDPKLAPAYVNRAELLSETEDKEFRRPAQAMKDARRGCELTDWKEPEALRALASAYAANGDFASAVRWQEKALKTGGGDNREEYSQLLAGYRKQIATTPPTTSVQKRSWPTCVSRRCSQQRSICRRSCGVFGALRFLKR